MLVKIFCRGLVQGDQVGGRLDLGEQGQLLLAG